MVSGGNPGAILSGIAPQLPCGNPGVSLPVHPGPGNMGKWHAGLEWEWEELRSSEYGTNETVQARLWPGILGKSRGTL